MFSAASLRSAAEEHGPAKSWEAHGKQHSADSCGCMLSRFWDF